MKNLLFESVWFLSNKDKKARTIAFHPRKNLIIGLNHTGKSSLIKNMFLTLGAKPTGKLEHWDVNTICAVSFKVNGRSYQVVYQRGSRALFQGDTLVLVSNASREWAEVFARIVGFNLLLTDKSTATVAADPKCFFLPFYIDQDGSWNAKWDTFTGLQQFKTPVKSILEYFTGIKPAKYYEVSSNKAQSQRTLEELSKEQKILNRAREKFNNAMSLSGPKLQLGNFEKEIERLTEEVTVLNTEQELLKEAAVREQELMQNIQLQINLANDTLVTYDKDTSYLSNEEKGVLLCPTCGAEHKNSFLDVLEYADDARSLRDIVLQLSDDFNKIGKKHAETLKKLSELDNHYQKVSAILDVRKGDIKLVDVLESMGAEAAFNVFEEESTELKAKIEANVIALHEFNEALKALLDRNRSKEILLTFRSAYRSSLKGLNLPLIDTDKLTISSRPDLSGSGGPRSILAYYAALWVTCRNERSDFSIPLVIDSPNQQGQDKVNLPTILKFISEHLPKDSQIILGSEIDAEHYFDNRIMLNVPYSLLLEEEYEHVNKAINPRVDLMYAQLKAKQIALEQSV